MNNKTLSKPLTDTEINHLSDFLSSIDPPSMNIEELDGYFAALNCCPDLVPPSEYLPTIWGEEFSFTDDAEATDVLSLLIRHWNTINGELQKALKTEGVYLPILLTAEDGIAYGNDWAKGFIRGMDMRAVSWRALIEDENNGGCIVPMMMLAHEHDPDPAMRPKPISPEKREEVLKFMIAGLVMAYRYFAARRQASAFARQDATVTPFRRIEPKLGRNDLCSCGSGRKYKHCCGSSYTVH
jgi:uncharacterized protein